MARGGESLIPVVTITNAKGIGLKQIGALANLKFVDRLAVIAEGMPIILRSMEGLSAAASALPSHLRAAEILDGLAREEAAKILILLDYVRCPAGRSDLAQTRLSGFYDHCCRLIYAESCTWKAWDIEMLRGYVDETRASHYVEGNLAEWIVPNWEVYVRESTLYADLGRSESGSLGWSDPHQSDVSLGSTTSSFLDTEPFVLRLVRAFSRLGFFSTEAIKLINNIWSPHPFVSACDGVELANRLKEQTITALIERGLVSDPAQQEDVGTVYNLWQLPMYAIEMKLRDVPLDILRAAQGAGFSQ